jgi:hypothetical protein
LALAVVEWMGGDPAEVAYAKDRCGGKALHVELHQQSQTSWLGKARGSRTVPETVAVEWVPVAVRELQTTAFLEDTLDEGVHLGRFPCCACWGRLCEQEQMLVLD